MMKDVEEGASSSSSSWESRDSCSLARRTLLHLLLVVALVAGILWCAAEADAFLGQYAETRSRLKIAFLYLSQLFITSFFVCRTGASRFRFVQPMREGRPSPPIKEPLTNCED